MKKSKTFRIALGGLCLALTVIFMFAGSFMPGIELTLYAISSVFVAIMIMESGVASGALLYVAAVLLGFILIPNKLALIPYAFFFGYYGIVKYYIEKLQGGVAQIIIKAIFFAAIMCVGLLGFKELLLGAVELPDFPVVILIAGGVIMMLLYDLIFSFVLNFYERRVQGKGADNIKLS